MIKQVERKSVRIWNTLTVFINQLDLVDIYRKLPNKSRIPIVSYVYGTFSKTNHSLPKLTELQIGTQILSVCAFVSFLMAFPGYEVPFPAYPSLPTWLTPLYLPKLLNHYLLCVPSSYPKEILSLHDCNALYIHSSCLYHSMLNYMYRFSASPTRL